ncbi:MAG: hypothetical protein K0V04_45750 [Deltaproteobacteria bacterium]|nr:hypothetical protein [Deltaproteobacteria bacterium]
MALAITSWGGVSACAVVQRVLSKEPVLVERTWHDALVFEEPEHAQLGRPSVFIDADGQPAVALANRAVYLGMQSLSVARRTATEGWRVEFPRVKSEWRVCGHAGPDGSVIVSFAGLDGPAQALSWDGAVAQPAEPGVCPPQRAVYREIMTDAGPRRMERSGDGRVLWDEGVGDARCPALDAAPGQAIDGFGMAVDSAGQLHVALYEAPPDAVGRLRHAVCDGSAWTSSLVAEDVVAPQVGMAIDAAGDPHIAYVAATVNQLQLRYATTAAMKPGPDTDARLGPASAACVRARHERPQGEGVAAYQYGDGFRCAVLERDPQMLGQARTQFTTACEADDAEACVMAGMSYDWLLARVDIALELPTAEGVKWNGHKTGIAVESMEDEPLRARQLYARGCALGDAQGCELFAFMETVGSKLRAEGAAQACAAGRPTGCAIAMQTVHLRVDDPMMDQAKPVLSAACDEGDWASCNNLAVIAQLRGETASARADFERACEGGVKTACTNLERVGAP